MRMTVSIALAAAFLCAAMPAGAYTDQDVVEWVGQGANTCYVAIDFDANPSSAMNNAFVFGVRFSSATITGLEALATIAEETPLQYIDAGGGFVTYIEYTFRDIVYSGSGEWPPWWAYWESADAGDNWAPSDWGCAAHTMSDGDASGWQHTWDTAWPPTVPPSGPFFEKTDMDDRVIEWVGAGDNAAYVVVDFEANPSSAMNNAFVFGVHFTSATITGLEALATIAQETDLAYTDVGGGYITYIEHTFRNTTYSGSGEWPPWWTYWESTNAGASWTVSDWGCAAHAMANGDASGWQHTWDTAWPPAVSPAGPFFEPNPMDDDVVEWAGNGPNCAYVVVDFHNSTTLSAEVVFGVSFTSETIGGLDALNMLHAETSLTVTDGGGGFITYMAYECADLRLDGDGTFPPWWSYWESDDSGASWTASDFGCAAHRLGHFHASGWVNTWDTLNFPPIDPPNGPRLVLADNGFAPVLLTQPVDFQATGDTAQFSVTVTGSTPMSYTWYFNGSALALDADHVVTESDTGSTLTISGVDFDDADVGNYRVRVQNPAGSVDSVEVALTRAATPTPTPTPEATATPTPTPTGTSEPLPHFQEAQACHIAADGTFWVAVWNYVENDWQENMQHTGNGTLNYTLPVDQWLGVFVYDLTAAAYQAGAYVHRH